MDYPLAIRPDSVQLTEREEKAYEKWKRGKDTTPLHLDVSMQLYELFLNGHTCEEIQRVNKKSGRDLNLGQILDARFRYSWDERRMAHQKELFDGVMVTAKQRQAEAIEFVSNQLAVAHKLHGDKLKKFLMTGDPADLGDFAPKTPTAYENAIRLFRLLTGQDQPAGRGAPQVNIINQPQQGGPIVEAGRPSGDNMHKLLELVAQEDKKNE